MIGPKLAYSSCTPCELTLFACDIHGQHRDWNVVFVGPHVLQDSRIQLFLEFTQVSRCETCQYRKKKNDAKFLENLFNNYIFTI